MFKYLLYLFILPCTFYGQSYDVEDINIGLSRGQCYVATITLDQSSLLGNGAQVFIGEVVNRDRNAAWTIDAYPRDEQPNASNKMSVTAYFRSGGHQEISISTRNKNEVFYPNRIKSSNDSYGYNFTLGEKGNDILSHIVGEEIRMNIINQNCNGNQSSNTQIIVIDNGSYNNAPTHSNVGCSELHTAIEKLSKSMYSGHFDDKKRASWTQSLTKEIFDLPGGCIGRDDEINKLYFVSKTVYDGNFDEDKRRKWTTDMIKKSFKKESRFESEDLDSYFEELVQESKEIFDWHDDQKRANWLTKKINKIYK